MYSKTIHPLDDFAGMRLPICIVALLLVQPLALLAQPLQPIGNSNSQLDSIPQVYQLTKTASKYDDFLEISKRCHGLLQGELTDKDKKYVGSLYAWSENRLARKELENARGLDGVGLQEQSQQALKKAVARFDRLLDSHPSLWRAWMGRATIHAQQGEYELALQKFQQVLKLNVKNSKARFNCAEILYELKDYEAAARQYTKVLADDATDVQALTGRGYCFLKLNQKTKAEDDFEIVQKLIPGNRQAILNLADLRSADTQNETAVSRTADRSANVHRE